MSEPLNALEKSVRADKLLPFRTVLVAYEGEELWHERLLLKRTGKTSWLILTPDEDMYEEDLADYVDWKLTGPRRGLPYGIPVGKSYRFPDPWYDDEDLEVKLKEANTFAAKWGLPVYPPVDAEAGAMVVVDAGEPDKAAYQVAPLEAGSVWIVTSPGSHYGREVSGDARIVRLGAHALLDSGFGILHLRAAEAGKAPEIAEECRKEWRSFLSGGGPELAPTQLAMNLCAIGDVPSDDASDARVLPVRRDEQYGERWRCWKTVSAALCEPVFDDWPLEGPRTVRWMATEIARAGGGSLQHHQRWRVAAKVDDSDRSVHEHEVLCLALELAGSYDQMELGALSSFEVLARRIQLIEESKAAGGASAYEGAKFFLGFHRGGTLLAPQLGRHVATKLQEEVAVMKERRKHQEERTLARTGAGAQAQKPKL